MMHVSAEQPTLDGDSDKPGFVPGFGGLSANAVRQIAKSTKLRPVHQPQGPAHARKVTLLCRFSCIRSAKQLVRALPRP
jgi:hypothetical protein